MILSYLGDLRPMARALLVSGTSHAAEYASCPCQMRVESRVIQGVWPSDFFRDQSNAQNYQRRMPVGHLFACGYR